MPVTKHRKKKKGKSPVVKYYTSFEKIPQDILIRYRSSIESNEFGYYVSKKEKKRQC